MHIIEPSEYTVLIVDDVANNVKLVGNILTSAGYKTYVSMHANQALAILAEIEVDLILLDISMPDINGFELCEQIKQKPSLKHIPVIFLTAQTELSSIPKAFEVGAVDYITKPFRSAELLKRIQNHLSINKLDAVIRERKTTLETTYQKLESVLNESIRITEELASSLKVGREVQSSLFENFGKNDLLINSFVLNLPKEIVGGDFFWTKNINNKLIVVVGDCTGHGVPGALLSVLSISLLEYISNKLLRETTEVSAALILEMLRAKIKEFLKQNEDKIAVYDGLDIALCVIDRANNVLQFAGAYNPMYVVRYAETQKSYTLIELKGDRMPIGIYPSEKPFSNQTIELQHEDALYLFSDGYPDQFGGPKQKRLKTSRFRKLLLDLSSHDFSKRESKLHRFFYKWKGDEEQVDDVLVVGLKYMSHLV